MVERADRCGALSQEFRTRCNQIGVQFGNSKVFFRLAAYARAESLRSRSIAMVATNCAAHVRGWLCKVRYQRKKAAIQVLQCATRVVAARAVVGRMRRANAAVALAAALRRLMASLRYRRTRRLAITLQRATQPSSTLALSATAG